MARIVRRLGVTSSPVVPSPRVAPSDEPALLVAQGDGEAVDLELRDVGQARRRLRCRRQAQALADAGVERAQLVVAERVARG